MEVTFQELCSSLEGLRKLYVEILRLAKMKRKELVLGNLKGVEEITKEEEQLVIEAGRLENERYQQSKQLSQQYDLPPEATLSDFIKMASDEDKAKLQDLQEQMTKLAAEIDEVNQENILLIEQSLKFINFSIDVLTTPSDVDTYDVELGKGQKKENISRILDKKI
ncbi:MAG: flagellar protein FlgN [Peptococcia bacterium]